MLTRVYLSISSNQNDPLKQVRLAVNTLKNAAGIQFQQASSLYKNPPLGGLAQPDYMNAVVALDTSLSALQLLETIQAIEIAQGRVRNGEKWHSRSLDIDILLYGDCIIHNEHLTIPHYDMKNRYCVLLPLLEVAPDLILPDGETLAALLQACQKVEMVKQ